MLAGLPLLPSRAGLLYCAGRDEKSYLVIGSRPYKEVRCSRNFPDLFTVCTAVTAAAGVNAANAA